MLGPLDGVRVVEIAGIGPGPFCAMLLADMGAEVVRIDRPASADGPAWPDLMTRGRRSVVVDLKHQRGPEVVLRLVESADALLEGFRPGVAERLGKLGLRADDLPPRADRERWPELRARLAAVFRTRTRAEWSELFEGSDACVAPVLRPGEAPSHPHNLERGAFQPVGGSPQPAPAPRFSRTPSSPPDPAPAPGQHTDEVLSSRGFDPEEIAALRAAGAIA